jgi:hypothetical protein
MKQKKKKNQNAPTWDTIPINGETLDVLRVWQLNDAAHKWPETAILRAKTTAAKLLAEDQTVLLPFLNDNDVFSKDVNAITSQTSATPGPVPCNTPHWDFIVIHGRASNAIVIEVPCFQ